MLRRLYRWLFDTPASRLQKTTFFAESTLDIEPRDRLMVVALNGDDEVTEVIYDYGFVQGTDGLVEHINFASRVPGRLTDRVPFGQFPLTDGYGLDQGHRVHITRWFEVVS